jgi:hypothetical protein
LALLLSQHGVAQQPQSAQPTETDLHAAYCTQVLKYLVEQLESSVTLFSGSEYSTVPGPNDPPELRASKAKAESAMREMRASLASEKAMARRLDLYLTPRLFNLDVVGIVAARRAAQEDWERIGSATSGCEKECPLIPDRKTDDPTKCNNECTLRAMPDLPTIQRKVKSCASLEWLPF